MDARYVQDPVWAPRHSLDNPDFVLRKIGYVTDGIVLDDGESYDLNGFAVGTYRVEVSSGASGSRQKYARFRAFLAANGDKTVEIQDAQFTGADTEAGDVELHSADEDFSVSGTAAADTVHFAIVEGNLVLINGTGSDGTNRSFRLTRVA